VNYLLLHDKLTSKCDSLNDRYLLYHIFCGSGIQEWFCFFSLLKVSHKVNVKRMQDAGLDCIHRKFSLEWDDRILWQLSDNGCWLIIVLWWMFLGGLISYFMGVSTHEDMMDIAATFSQSKLSKQESQKTSRKSFNIEFMRCRMSLSPYSSKCELVSPGYTQGKRR
jgi:hypothetical protein